MGIDRFIDECKNSLFSTRTPVMRNKDVKKVGNWHLWDQHSSMEQKMTPYFAGSLCIYTSRIGHLCSAFTEWVDVIVVGTHDTLGMFDPLTLPPQIPIHWGQSLGIRRVAEARRLSGRAEALVMAPLSTRTLAKIHAGISNNLVTAAFMSCHCLRIFLALDTTRNLWSNPMTQVHLQDLQRWYRTTSIQPSLTDKFVSMDEDLLRTMAQGSFFPEEK
ncbi:hypothetical protein LguiA_009669 [Lonicera macranthoides]